MYTLQHAAVSEKVCYHPICTLCTLYMPLLPFVFNPSGDMVREDFITPIDTYIHVYTVMWGVL